MNKWYLTAGSNLMLNQETDRCYNVTDCYTNINCCYIAPEDCTLYFNNSVTDGPVQYEVKKGQVVLTFYKDTLPHQIVILDSDKFKENLQFYMDEMQKEKERWAADKTKCASENTSK
jgi:hypothetical protein